MSRKEKIIRDRAVIKKGCEDALRYNKDALYVNEYIKLGADPRLIRFNVVRLVELIICKNMTIWEILDYIELLQ